MRSVIKENILEKDEINAVKQAEALVPTEWGSFYMTAYADDAGDYTPHIVMKHPDVDVEKVVYVRVHSECITGDIFHSQKCDCGQQLQESMKMIEIHRGVLIYLRQEGRGIGIINKLKAYKHQEQGLDTIQANEALGLDSDYRKYDIASSILRSLGINKINLITNNPDKISGITKDGVEVVKRIPLIINPTENSEAYLKTKQDMMGHLLTKEDEV